jgi:hypothetical protein
LILRLWYLADFVKSSLKICVSGTVSFLPQSRRRHLEAHLGR